MNPRLRIAVHEVWTQYDILASKAQATEHDRARMRTALAELIQASRQARDDASRVVNIVTG
jgi:hypothetical protein